jgi:delta1-piperideine-2-carboxylate reductase
MTVSNTQQRNESSYGIHKVQISIPRATALCESVLMKAGYSQEQAAIITDHLIDAELRGHPFAGMARALSIVEQLKASDKKTDIDIEVTRSGGSFAHLDGHDAVGYLVARKATEIAIEKAKSNGVSVVGANGLW